MFAKTIIDDAFLDIFLSIQVLYFHLSMRTDDVSLVNSPQRIVRMINPNIDDLTVV